MKCSVTFKLALTKLAILLAWGAAHLAAQDTSLSDESGDGMLRAAMLGQLPTAASLPATEARTRCLAVPTGSPNNRLEGPHGDLLITSSCQVIAFGPLQGASAPRWRTARYRWASLYTAEDTTRGEEARDTVAEEEVVLFEVPELGRLLPVWHARFETGDYAMWRSITPELRPLKGGVLLGIMYCVNGTGGCSQEFLRRPVENKRWSPIRQVWLHQLPDGFAGRMQRGIHIDPGTLVGKGGFYTERDANCCPSQELMVSLGLQGDSLVLWSHALRPATDR